MSSYEFKTVVGENLEVKVCFDYQPYEPPEPTYPGCEAEVTITCVLAGKLEWGGFDISEDLNKQCLSRLEAECFEQIELSSQEQGE